MSGPRFELPAEAKAPSAARFRAYERLALGVCLALTIALAWLYLVVLEMPMAPFDVAPSDAVVAAGHAGMSMDDMPGMAMPESASPMAMAPLSFGLLAAMWIAMMIGMMLPSASPMILMAARMSRFRPGSEPVPLGPWAFALGYLIAWAGFSLVAAAAQLGLQAGLLSAHDMAIRSAPIAGGILIAAGVYQWTPLKAACLTKCRSPLGHFMSGWRPGRFGGVRMGIEHGLFCIGCCWLLMTIMFVFGVMSLPWLGALAAFVLVEKLAPRGDWIARGGGLAMLGAGVYLIVAG